MTDINSNGNFPTITYPIDKIVSSNTCFFDVVINILTVVELINKAAISVTDVTVIETPACFIALATLSLAGNFFSS